jgi:hypothetical protein
MPDIDIPYSGDLHLIGSRLTGDYKGSELIRYCARFSHGQVEDVSLVTDHAESSKAYTHPLTVHSYYAETNIPVGAPYHPQAIEIRRVLQRDGSWLWLIKDARLEGGPVLSKDLLWEYPSLPSNRCDEELQRTRYSSIAEATTYLERYIAQALTDRRAS